MKTNLFAITAFLAAGLLLSACTPSTEVKNVIYIIGDGMGWGAVSTPIMQRLGADSTAFSRITHIGCATTFSADAKVTDSAAGGTALAAGEKTNNGTVGINAAGDTLTSVLVKAQQKGMATGIVVNTAILDATPAAFYGHVAKRAMWFELAEQMTQNPADVFIGAGLPSFTQRPDSVDLLPRFTANGYQVVTDWPSFEALNPDSMAAEKVAALFSYSSYRALQEDVPGFLPKVVAKALAIFDKIANPNGFFLMIEEAQIDGQGHTNNSEGMVAEMEVLNQVLTQALDYADAHPGTLVILTADHETGGTTIGYGAEPKFSTTGHSGMVVPVFAYGPGADHFCGFMDNVDIPKKIEALLK